MDTDHRTEENRRALIDQLAYLIDEVHALKRHVDLVPVAVLQGRPFEGAPSLKEIYALIALYDERVYQPALAEISANESAHISIPERDALLSGRDWNEVDMEAVIERVAAARSQLVARLERTPVDAWRRTVTVDGKQVDLFGLAYGIAQHDAERLSEAAYRLHESRLTSRDEDLPK